MSSSSKKIFLALDNLAYEEMLSLVKELGDQVVFKINDAFTRFGPGLIWEIHRLGGEVFLDLKFHDIPNTVVNYLKAVADLQVYMCNVHCLGGFEMMQTASSELVKYCQEKKLRCPILIGVTILTSLDNQSLTDELQIKTKDVAESVIHLAKLAKQAGLDGVVCSPLEITKVKDACGQQFLTVTPGIRPAWSVADDQKRITHPKEAIQLGANYLVIGRPITNAQKFGLTRKEAVSKILQEIETTAETLVKP